MQWNCRGANSKCPEISELVNSRPVCIFLNETYLSPEIPLSVHRYISIRQDRIQSAASAKGGAAILLLDSATVIREKRFSETSQTLSEWISLDIIPSSSTASIRIITGYCPPSSVLDVKWLEREFEDASSKQMACVFAGDLNARSPIWGREPWNPHGYIVNNLVNSLGLHVIRSKPTRIDTTTGKMSTLDIWIANELARSFVPAEVCIGDRYGSDHFVTSVKCRMPQIGYLPPPLANQPPNRYNVSKANKFAYAKTLHQLLAQVVVPAEGQPVAEISRYREDILSCIVRSREKNVPKATPLQISRVQMSQEMRSILSRKRIIERFLKNVHDSAMLEQLRDLDQQFREAKQRHQIRRDTERLREVEKLSAQQRYREAWARLRKLDRRSAHAPIGPLRSSDGRIIKPSEDLANELLCHFTAPMVPYSDPAADDAARAHWQRVETEISKSESLKSSDVIRLPKADEFSVSQLMIARAFLRLKPLKAPGHDGIQNVFYKWGGNPLQMHLRRLFNMSLGSSYAVPAWKEAIVIPVPKVGKPAGLVSSFRPISLLANDGKILEAIVSIEMSKKLERLNFLPEEQYAFREHRSAPDIPLQVIQRVHNNRAARRPTVLITLDVKAAYDSVWHPGLLFKLLRFPLPRNLTAWLCDYLHDRKLQAQVAGFLSVVATVNCGVPQGSPLSPLLYILYTADLFGNSEPNTTTEGYADDLSTTATGENVSSAVASAQAEINRISYWASMWRQQFNAEKSEVIHLSHRPVAIEVKLARDVIPQKKVVRVLGLHLDERLTFKEHVDKVITSCRGNMGWFRRIVSRPGLSRRWRRTAYYSLIRSRLSYGNVAIAAMSKRQLKRLSVVQNNCLRAILNVKIRDRVPVSELQERCNVVSLPSFFAKCQKRYIRNAVSFVLPIREAVENARLSNLARGPVPVLMKYLKDEALPSLPI